MNDIPTEEARYRKLVSTWQLRYLRSVQAFSDDFDRFRRMERWWERVQEDAVNGEEYAVLLGYAFSIVERMHAKITEPLFNMGLPCDTYPRQLGDMPAVQNLQHIQRAFYSGPNFQEALSDSKKSMCIVGHRWEIDGWTNVEASGKMWAEVPQAVKVIRDGKEFVDLTKVIAEVPIKRPVHYGFMTEFPDWDRVFPEPGRKTIDTGQKTDMSWLLWDLGDIAIEDLAKHVQYDPNTKTNVPLYDLEKMLAHYGKAAQQRYQRIMDGGDSSADAYGQIIRPERTWDQPGRSYDGRGTPPSYRPEDDAREDRDKVRVFQCREANEILTIAQGKWIIHRKIDPWHVPGLKARIECYTRHPKYIYGKGAIEPIESEASELNDIHSLSMDNIFRLVHKMTFVREDALTSEDDIVNPRAAGLVRIKSDQADISKAVMESTPVSPVQEMIGIESELRGLIEFVSMELDGSPGVMGTKQQHKTASGQQQIINNMSPAYGRWQRQARINECRRCKNMADMIDQFHWEKQSYRITRLDGSTVFAELDRTDIATQGRGFDFGYSVDPQWGNPQQRLSMKRQVYVDGVEYNKLPPAVRGDGAPMVDVGELFRDILQESGYIDTSRVFKPADGSMSPEHELQVIAQGGVVRECKGNQIEHIKAHILQAQDPKIKAAIETGKMHPDTIRRLGLLVEQTQRELMTFLKNPEMAAARSLDRPPQEDA